VTEFLKIITDGKKRESACFKYGWMMMNMILMIDEGKVICTVSTSDCQVCLKF
jgi:hypothetical protein